MSISSAHERKKGAAKILVGRAATTPITLSEGSMTGLALIRMFVG
jgi:hypothetical protein